MRLDFAGHEQLRTGQLGVASVERPRADPAAPGVHPDHAGQRRAARHRPHDDDDPVAAADPRDGGRPSRSCRSSALRLRNDRVPRLVGRPAAGRRGRRRRRRSGQRGADREGLRRRGPRESNVSPRAARMLYRARLRLVRLQATTTSTLSVGARPGPGGGARRSADGWPCGGPVARHLPVLLQLSRAARAAGADAGVRRRRGAAGQGRRRARPRRPRCQLRGRRCPRCRDRSGRCGARSCSRTCSSATGGPSRCSTGSTCASAPGEVVALVGGSGSGKSTVAGPAPPVLRPARTAGSCSTGSTCAPWRWRRSAATDRGGVRGSVPVLRHGPREHRLRPTRRIAMPTCAPRPRSPTRSSFIEALPERVRHRRRRTRPHPVGRTAPAHRTGPRRRVGSGDPRARRRHLGRRHRRPRRRSTPRCAP